MIRHLTSLMIVVLAITLIHDHASASRDQSLGLAQLATSYGGFQGLADNKLARPCCANIDACLANLETCGSANTSDDCSKKSQQTRQTDYTKGCKEDQANPEGATCTDYATDTGGNTFYCIKANTCLFTAGALDPKQNGCGDSGAAALVSGGKYVAGKSCSSNCPQK